MARSTGKVAAVHAVVGLAAVVGGIGLVRNGLGMPEEWLLSTPFDTWLIPGVLLALGVGGSQLLAAVLLAAHDPQARSASMVDSHSAASALVPNVDGAAIRFPVTSSV